MEYTHIWTVTFISKCINLSLLESWDMCSKIPKCLRWFLGLSDGTKACVLSNTLYCLMLERPLPFGSCAVNRPKRGFYCITDSREADCGAVRQYLAQWWGKIIKNICLTLLHLVKIHLRFAFLSRWDSKAWKMLYVTPTASFSSMLIKPKYGRLQLELQAKCRSALANWNFVLLQVYL